MQISSERILTTHTGSLPRPDDLLALLHASDHAAVSSEAIAQRAVRQVVQQQAATGIDIINDGEQAKASFATYVTDRLTGFAPEHRPRPDSLEYPLFPDYYRARAASVGTPDVQTCTGPIAWQGDAQVQRDLANFRDALTGAETTEAFLTAASPGTVWFYQPNAYYPTHGAYIQAAAEAMQHEYEAIHAAGFLLQIDAPDLASGWNRPDFAGKTVEDFRQVARLHIEALNYATRTIPPERMRLHICWGNFEGPHVRDIPLAQLIDILLEARPAGLSFEGANPRHEHEWKLFQTYKLPEGKILIPGVIDSTTNFVEHPDLVAERIVRYATAAGRDRVIAGTDCGFATLARTHAPVHPTIAWAKLRALVEGARLASRELW